MFSDSINRSQFIFSLDALKECPHSLTELLFPKHVSLSCMLYNLVTYFVYFLFYPHKCKLFDSSHFL